MILVQCCDSYTNILNASVAVVVVFIVYDHVLYSNTLHIYYKARDRVRDSTRQYETVQVAVVVGDESKYIRPLPFFSTLR